LKKVKLIFTPLLASDQSAPYSMFLGLHDVLHDRKCHNSLPITYFTMLIH